MAEEIDNEIWITTLKKGRRKELHIFKNGTGCSGTSHEIPSF